jgi:bifunctional DNase/RNase
MGRGDFIEIFILGITNTPSQKNSYTIIFGNDLNEFKLPIVVGSYEAQSIALVIEGIKPSRPLTHDLIMNVFESIQMELKEIRIHKLDEGVFHATLVGELNGEIVEVDSRSSDAIALALRADCPIYTTKSIIDTVGVILDTDISDDASQPQEKKSDVFDPVVDNDYARLSTEELKIELEKAIQIEDYDTAVIIRDELSKRKK